MCAVWATLFTVSQSQHVKLCPSLCLSKTERPRSMETTKFKEASLFQVCNLRSFPSFYTVMFRRERGYSLL